MTTPSLLDASNFYADMDAKLPPTPVNTNDPLFFQGFNMSGEPRLENVSEGEESVEQANMPATPQSHGFQASPNSLKAMGLHPLMTDGHLEEDLYNLQLKSARGDLDYSNFNLSDLLAEKDLQTLQVPAHSPFAQPHQMPAQSKRARQPSLSIGTKKLRNDIDVYLDSVTTQAAGPFEAPLSANVYAHAFQESSPFKFDVHSAGPLSAMGASEAAESGFLPAPAFAFVPPHLASPNSPRSMEGSFIHPSMAVLTPPASRHSSSPLSTKGSRAAAMASPFTSLAPGSPTLSSTSAFDSPSESGDGSKKYKCPKPYCSKSYKNSNGLKYHMERGNCEMEYAEDAIVETSAGGTDIKIAHRPYWCRVPGCGKKYKNLNGLKYHAKASHPELDFKGLVKGHSSNI